MSKFEFFMAIYGLLLGLALAELLSALGALLRARVQPRWGVLTPLSVACVFVMVLTCYLDAWRSLESVSPTLRSLAAPIAIAISLFLAAIMVVPRDAVEWPDLDAYFMARRRLVFGPLLVPVVLTISVFEAPRWVATGGPSASYVAYNLLLLALQSTPLVTRRPRVIAVALALFVVLLAEGYFTEMTIDGQFRYLFG